MTTPPAPATVADAMDLKRHHFLLIGLLALAIGTEFRLVDNFTLNEPAAKFLAQKLERVRPGSAQELIVAATGTPEPYRVISPPKWIGWSLISIGAVLTFQSLSMRKEGG
ncbi:MAG TPA: hypothetical protein VGN57_23440 [Pirellulaceae bacterium]|nr:hypothetical protein [Pirellulaceae bacterium]